MSIKQMFETAPHLDALSHLCHGQKRTEMAIRRYAGCAAAGRA